MFALFHSWRAMSGLLLIFSGSLFCCSYLPRASRCPSRRPRAQAAPSPLLGDGLRRVARSTRRRGCFFVQLRRVLGEVWNLSRRACSRSPELFSRLSLGLRTRRGWETAATLHSATASALLQPFSNRTSHLFV
ncbi:hypothetical protein BCR35DRAFT_58486 [Leucosporidium creatinivorum]|uniref:Uncharacterized protein n=1 Tax=Leucosporidium creatinivorum TaxID=106004 RepID=A0A1Y2FMW3_9BASI|nr:hypothetical protein BCR35DRAFT_58486 [Leucosporidium creatinivorum]